LYAYDESEREEILKSMKVDKSTAVSENGEDTESTNTKGISISRFKGLEK
jgi:hypothetical protein